MQLKDANAKPLDDSKVVVKITVQFGDVLRTAPGETPHEKLKAYSSNTSGLLRAVLEHTIEHIQTLQGMDTEKGKAALTSTEAFDDYQCAYYGHGSCPWDPDQCYVCCWFGTDPEPICGCDPC